MSSFDARRHALAILLEAENIDGFADKMLHSARDSAELHESDYRLLQHLVRGTLQHRSELDDQIAPHLTRTLDSLDPLARAILRMGAYQIRYFDRVPMEVAVNDSVELAKSHGHAGISRLVNAVLRKVAASPAPPRPPDNETVAEPELARRLNHPPWIVSRWISRFGRDATIALCEINNAPAPTFLRTNLLRVTRDELKRLLANEGIATELVSADDRFLKITRREVSLGALSTFKNGFFQIQDPSAALVARIVQAAPGERVLDMCSAPGGKTTYLAELMGDDGVIVACDRARPRLISVRENAERLGLTSIHLIVGDGTSPPLRPDFDRVLLDVPCTGLGVLGRRVDARWKKFESNLKQLTPLQGELLEQGGGLVRRGGTVVYSTCSIEREENEEIVTNFLRAHPDYTVAPLPPEIPPTMVTPEGFFLSLPHRDGIGGAFAAALRRS